MSKAYGRMLIMVILSFASMYVLMYAMVNTFGNVLSNYNQVYMAGLMTAPMVMIELGLMWSMYPNRTANIALCSVALVALFGCWLGIREQVAIDDQQFPRSMVPHHAGAILMCDKAPIRDAEIRRLCKSIAASQQAEIDEMKAILGRLSQS